MQDNMILEQEQLLFAIDDIDDAQIMAEAAVIGKMVDLYLHQAMIQEAMANDEAFESYFQEANKEAAQDKEGPSKFAQFKENVKGKASALGEKIKNFDFKTMLSSVLRAIANIFKAMISNLKKVLAHFKPSYVRNLIRSKSSDLARAAKKNGCKVKANTDGTYTLMFLLPDLTGPAKMCTQFEKWLEKFKPFLQHCREDSLKSISDYQVPQLGKIKEPYPNYKDLKNSDGSKTEGFTKKWMSIEELAADTIGHNKTQITTGNVVRVNGIVERLGKIIQDLEWCSSIAKSIPTEVYGDADAAAANKKTGARNRATKFFNKIIADLNDFLKVAQNVQTVISTEYNKAVADAKKIDAEIRNYNSKTNQDIREENAKRTANGKRSRIAASEDIRSNLTGGNVDTNLPDFSSDGEPIQ